VVVVDLLNSDSNPLTSHLQAGLRDTYELRKMLKKTRQEQFDLRCPTLPLSLSNSNSNPFIYFIQAGLRSKYELRKMLKKTR